MKTYLRCRNLYKTLTSLGFLFLAHSASAGLCVIPPEKGTWVNEDPNTSGITKIVVETECISNPIRKCNADGTICSITHSVYAVNYLKLWGKCHPTDCYWGKVEARYSPSRWLYGFYDHDFATRDTWVRISSESNDRMRLIVDTDFVSATRKDYRIDDWFKRK